MAVVIKDVQKHSPAEKYGIKAEDTIVAINGEEINDMLDLQFYQSNDFRRHRKICYNNRQRRI